MLNSTLAQASEWKARKVAMAEAVHLCAKGLYSDPPAGSGRNLACTAATRSRESATAPVGRLTLARALSFLAGHDALDVHNAGTLLRLPRAYPAGCCQRSRSSVTRSAVPLSILPIANDCFEIVFGDGQVASEI